jgi:hypothetical protein
MASGSVADPSPATTGFPRLQGWITGGHISGSFEKFLHELIKYGEGWGKDPHLCTGLGRFNVFDVLKIKSPITRFDTRTFRRGFSIPTDLTGAKFGSTLLRLDAYLCQLFQATLVENQALTLLAPPLRE